MTEVSSVFVLNVMLEYKTRLRVKRFLFDQVFDREQQICIYRHMIIGIVVFYHRHQNQDLHERLSVHIVKIPIYYIIQTVVPTIVALYVKIQYLPRTAINSVETEKELIVLFFFCIFLVNVSCSFIWLNLYSVSFFS